MKRVAAGLAGELGTEYLQEITHDLVANFASQIDDEVKAGDVMKTSGQFMDMIGPMSIVMLPLVMFGAGVEIRNDIDFAKDYDWQLSDESLLRVNGFSAEQAKEIVGAGTTLQQAVKFKELWNKRTFDEVPDEVKAQAKQRVLDFAEGRIGKNEPEETAPIISEREGEYFVKYPDGQISHKVMSNFL